MRGRSGISLLCPENRFASVHDLLKSFHHSGRIDLTTLFLTRGYPFPPADLGDFELFPGHIVPDPEGSEVKKGFVSIGEVAALLSHRQATPYADDY
jgi:hypothetical protein